MDQSKVVQPDVALAYHQMQESLNRSLDQEGETNLVNNEYHFAEGAKILGVHKQERRKSIYLFVIVVRWSDKSHVTIYREWKEIKKLQHELLDMAKNSESCSDSRRYLKKTGQRARKIARFQQGTMQRLNMIDSLNQYFEAVVHFKELAQSQSSRKFFKPNEKDLTALSWSGDGRTYFYVSRDILGERNKTFGDENDQELYLEEDDALPNARICIGGDDQKKIVGDVSDVMDKFCESDPGISWPIRPSVYVAVCDYEPSRDDTNQNIIRLRKEEEFDVLDRNESGWWLVKRSIPTDENSECGYAPATYLEPKESEGFPTLRLPSEKEGIENEDETCTIFSEDCFDSAYAGSSESSYTSDCFLPMPKSLKEYDIDPLRESAQQWRSDRRYVSKECFRLDPLDENQVRDSDDEMGSENSERSSSPSLSSLESLSPLPRIIPEPSSGRRTVGVIDSTGVPFRRSVPSSLRPRTYSGGDTDLTVQRKSRTRRQTLDSLPAQVLLNVTSGMSWSAGNSPALSRNSSLLSIARPGVDYISMKEYHAENPDEISFNEGAIISVFRRNTNGWWMASYQGKTGLVPGVNLKRYQDPIHRLGLQVFDML